MEKPAPTTSVAANTVTADRPMNIARLQKGVKVTVTPVAVAAAVAERVLLM